MTRIRAALGTICLWAYVRVRPQYDHEGRPARALGFQPNGRI